MKILDYHKPAIKFSFKQKQSSLSSAIDFREELSMFRKLDNKISNDIFIKNLLGK